MNTDPLDSAAGRKKDRPTANPSGDVSGGTAPRAGVPGIDPVARGNSSRRARALLAGCALLGLFVVVVGAVLVVHAHQTPAARRPACLAYPIGAPCATATPTQAIVALPSPAQGASMASARDAAAIGAPPLQRLYATELRPSLATGPLHRHIDLTALDRSSLVVAAALGAAIPSTIGTAMAAVPGTATPTLLRIQPTETDTPRTPAGTSTPYVPTRTPTLPTATITLTITASPSLTRTPTARPTATSTASNTATRSPKASITSTPEATGTSTGTPTGTATATRTATPSPTPADIDLRYSYAVADRGITITWRTSFVANMAIDGMQAPANGSRSYSLATHTYLLVATSLDGTERRIQPIVVDLAACSVTVNGRKSSLSTPRCRAG